MTVTLMVREEARPTTRREEETIATTETRMTTKARGTSSRSLRRR